ncbi:hypothetical protein AURDEDRAFT_117074 [Auricularia subglabra TFB-10046 SS5]|uniref:SET domain-containing protein n=1 Tax=Auricularia subglabra (strain TFB-10046 / SS5) TaxID=717982 RepID=J0WT72_AURST|nr:hypothetical protein AURDEDRAFT_117074 [Auricularia subglabra TFB-10046 SS5]
MLAVRVPSASLSSLSVNSSAHAPPPPQSPTPPVRRVSARPPPSAWNNASTPAVVRPKPQRPARTAADDSSDDDIELQQLASRLSSFLTVPTQPSAPPAPAPKPVDEGPKDPHLREIKRLADRVPRCPQVVKDMLVSPTPAAANTLTRTKRIHALMEVIAADRDLATATKYRALNLPRTGGNPRDAARLIFAAGLFEIAYARYRDILADTPAQQTLPAASTSKDTQPPSVRRQSLDTTSGGSSSDHSNQTHSTAATSAHSTPSKSQHGNESTVSFPSAVQTGEDSAASPGADGADSDLLDLLAKLAAAALRAALPSSAARHAQHALSLHPHGIRARLFAASAALDLGLLNDARKHLSCLPPDLTDVSTSVRLGKTPDGRTFGKSVPDWVRLRMGAERRRLERMLAERDEPEPRPRKWAFAEDTAAGVIRMNDTHAMALPGMRLTPAGYTTTRAIGRGTVLAIAPPLACATTFTAPGTEELPLARLADILRNAIRGNPELGRALDWAASRLPSKSEVVQAGLALGVSDSRAALLCLVQTRVLRLPRAACGMPAVGIYFPAVHMAAGDKDANAMAGFAGPALVLRAVRDLDEGEIISVDFGRVGVVERVFAS